MSVYNLKVNFEKHYFRRNMHEWKNSPSANHSVVLHGVTLGKLVTLDEIVNNVLSNKDNDSVKNKRQVETLLADLIKDGGVTELHGERIYHWLSKL